jgi:hypothetical protein
MMRRPAGLGNMVFRRTQPARRLWQAVVKKGAGGETLYINPWYVAALGRNSKQVFAGATRIVTKLEISPTGEGYAVPLMALSRSSSSVAPARAYLPRRRSASLMLRVPSSASPSRSL